MATILVIDDEPTFRDMVTQLLRLHGHTVIEAENGRRGMRAVLDHSPDLVLCDIVMPEMEGEETIAAIRRLSPTIHVIACTGSADHCQLYLRIAKFLGAEAVLPKPMPAHVLLHTINHLLKAPSPVVASHSETSPVALG